eukprot:TRINITY_DN4553_c0_g1_i1.p1 TRINITY_DN4553_c0_g1~~TRINITY_DN4553_c0_g1_i1.p1  ORF type:complete len:233 (-),score=53.22 TRINITY_DN4553_c0_g1_i1:134-832(-)
MEDKLLLSSSGSNTTKAKVKKINNACHFCDHAAVRSGRRKIAMQVACSRASCKKVFCSRPSCIKKLPACLNVRSHDEFALWKSNVDNGLTVFICPHCQDERSCGGPQCLKRYQIKMTRKASKASSSKSSAAALLNYSNNSGSAWTSPLSSRQSSPSSSSSCGSSISSSATFCHVRVPRPVLLHEIDPFVKAEMLQNITRRSDAYPRQVPPMMFSFSSQGAFSLVQPMMKIED